MPKNSLGDWPESSSGCIEPLSTWGSEARIANAAPLVPLPLPSAADRVTQILASPDSKNLAFCVDTAFGVLKPLLQQAAHLRLPEMDSK